MGAQRAEAIANLEGMGFERAAIEAAMRAAFFNPDRAVEYLLNGIPDNIQSEQRPAAPASGAAAAAQPQAQAGGEANDDNVNLFEAAARVGADAPRGGNAAEGEDGDAAGLGNLDWLRNNPQFQQLRQVVQQQPQMLEPILQSVGAGNPQLAQLIGAHPEQFLQLLGEEGEEGDMGAPPGATQISVTPEEQQAIERVSWPTLCGHDYCANTDVALRPRL